MPNNINAKDGARVCMCVCACVCVCICMCLCVGSIFESIRNISLIELVLRGEEVAKNNFHPHTQTTFALPTSYCPRLHPREIQFLPIFTYLTSKTLTNINRKKFQPRFHSLIGVISQDHFLANIYILEDSYFFKFAGFIVPEILSCFSQSVNGISQL